MNDVDALFFDFDGVILESVDVKTVAFCELFKDYTEYSHEILSFHLANPGLSRFEKFPYIFDKIIHKPLSNRKFKELCRNLSDMTYIKVLACDFVAGTIEFLEKYYKKIPLFIITGTPQDEITNIVKAKGLKKYFKGVFGSPTTKIIWIKDIIKKQGFNPKKVIYIGDSVSDYESAKENSLFFIARIKDLEDNIFKNIDVDFKIKDLFELDKFIT